MKAAMVTRYGDTDVLKIQEIEKPKLKKREVLIEVKAAALNPKDILIRKGKFKMATGNRFPKGIGYDLAGIVAESNGSYLFKKGDKLFGMINGWKGRAVAEFANVSEKELFRLPQNCSFEDAAGIPLAGQTALQAIRDLGKLKSGQLICINGASGGVGTLAIQIAKSLGGVVTAVTSFRNKDLCLSLGADGVIDYTKEDILNSTKRFDVFFDVFGNYSFPKVAHLLNKKGSYVSTVPSPKIIVQQIRNPFRSKKAKLVVVKSNIADLKWLCKKIEEGAIKPVTDKTFNLEDIQEAQKYIETKRAKGKVIIKI